MVSTSTLPIRGRILYAQIIAGLSLIAFSETLQAQVEGPVPGMSVWDRDTNAPAPIASTGNISLQMAPIVVQKSTDFSAILKANGVEPEASVLRSIKLLNPRAFDGNNLRAGYAAFFPIGQFPYPADRTKYTIKGRRVDDHNVLASADVVAGLQRRG
jgi:hypothetical protein